MIIAFANHKGGTGKTTSAINIGRALSKSGKKVLLVDLDVQGNLTYSLGLSAGKYSIADFLLQSGSFENMVFKAHDMDVLPADDSLYAKTEVLERQNNPSLLLRNALSGIKNNYDFILLDCSPSMSLYTFNALNAADKVIIPVTLDILSIQGLDQILSYINKISKSTNPELSVLGVLGVIVNENRKLTQEVLEYIRENYNVNIFNNHVRNNVKAAEAPSFGESILDYAPASLSAKDYTNVTKELLKILETEIQTV